MADDGLLSKEVATCKLAREALERLDHAWPESSTLGLDADADARAFLRGVQYLVDRGLMQYELFMAGDPPVYRFAAITQHGREVLRQLRERAA